jgi:hypothetical protein
MSRFSRNTPWGYADQSAHIGGGIYRVDTPSHGGYFVPDSMLHRIPLEQQEWAERWSQSRNWWEEDCCWAAVAVAFPELFPAEALPIARATLARYFPSPAPAGGKSADGGDVVQ